MTVGPTPPLPSASIDVIAPGTMISPATAQPPAGGRGGAGNIRGREGRAAWVFVTPVIIILGLFLVIPVFIAIWVSLSNWSGKGSCVWAERRKRGTTPAPGWPNSSRNPVKRCNRKPLPEKPG